MLALSLASNAVCLVSSEQTSVVNKGGNIAANLFTPLEKPDVFLSLLKKQGKMGVLHRKHSPETFSRVLGIPIKEVVVTEYSPGKLAYEMEKLSYWYWLMQRVGGKNCKVRDYPASTDLGTTYDCPGLWMGNSFLAPVVGDTGALFELKQQLGCWNALTKQEQVQGRLYDRIIYSRLDFYWLAPHVALKLLRLELAPVWIPQGEDYGGVNDRHAVLSRYAASIYLRRFELIQNGTIVQMLTEQPSHKLEGWNSETFLDKTLAFFQLSVQRYAPVQFLACCEKKNSYCFNPNCKECWLHGKKLRGKYELEMQAAVQHVADGMTNDYNCSF
ncbi:MAG: hypothetical protein SGPRY_012656 [Prymnesium sp.]